MNNILDVINESKKIILLTHENPDGDAIGSVMAFYHMLKKFNKDIEVVIPEIPDRFLFMDSIDVVKKSSSDEFDLGIILDCASKERIGEENNEFNRCKKTIVIDHHETNSLYGDINHIEMNISSCAQVIYYLFKDYVNQKAGSALAVGLLTDTAGFRNCNVDKNTFLMAAELIDLGVNIYNIYYLVLSKKTDSEYALMKMTLDRMELFEDGKIAFSYISHEDMENVGAKLGDHEGLVDLGRNIDGVEVSIFMREDDGYNISFRSNGLVNVNNIAKKFNGGGHRMAAGAKSRLSFKETKEKVINETIKEFNK